jgi:hypothetical protein
MSQINLPKDPLNEFTPKPATRHPLLVCPRCPNDDVTKFSARESNIFNVMKVTPAGGKLLLELKENILDDAKYTLFCERCTCEFKVDFDDLIFDEAQVE